MPRLPIPEYIGFKQWSVEIIRLYKNERLPIVIDEDKWEEWGTSIAGIGIFKTNAIPSPSVVKDGRKINTFKTWQDWAKAVYTIMIKVKGK